MADLQCGVGIGLLLTVGRHETLSLNLAHGSKHLFATDALAEKPRQHRPAGLDKISVFCRTQRAGDPRDGHIARLSASKPLDSARKTTTAGMKRNRRPRIPMNKSLLRMRTGDLPDIKRGLAATLPRCLCLRLDLGPLRALGAGQFVFRRHRGGSVQPVAVNGQLPTQGCFFSFAHFVQPIPQH